MKKHCLLRSALAFTGLAIMSLNINAEALWLRDAQISPDGKTIAFTYMGDIWTVPSTGGDAKRITETDNAYEDRPIWSPDSKKIAFSSDRSGNFEIYITDATGGRAKQLTYYNGNAKTEAFTPDGNKILFSATIQDPAQSALFPSARMTELYEVSVNGGNAAMIVATPVQLPSFSKENPEILYYQDYKGMEDEWRKHHTSSVTRDVWSLNLKTGEHKNLTNRPGEDRNPVATDNKIYFLRENPGESMNVFVMEENDPNKISQITTFKEHPVRFLSGANDGTLAFTYDGEIYTLKQNGKPHKLIVNAVSDNYQQTKKIDIRSIEEAVPSPDGTEIAFISRGEVFVTPVDYSTTKQITHTPQAERHLGWSPDGKKIIYTSERDGHWNIYTAEKTREEDPNFSNATLITEKPLFNANDKVERTFASYSPDGKKIAYIKDRNKLVVKDLSSGKETQILNGKTHKSRGGGYGYEWSPDSKWIVTEGVLHGHDPYSDVFIVNIDNGELIPLTETGYFDESPRFALDGNAVIFASDRLGMRNHASWGSQQDIFIVFLNEEAYDKFRMSEEDFKLQQEAKKDSDKASQKEESKKQSKDKAENDKKENAPINVEAKGIQDRLIRLTPASGDIADAIVTADGETLYYIASFNQDYDLWKVNLRDRKTEQSKKIDGRAQFVKDKDGKNLFLVSRNSVKKFDPKSEKITPISFGGKMELNEAAERAYMFDYVKRQEREMFYDTTMHGVDWENLTEHYRRFLPHITNNYDFAELLSELLGELNVSHTGGRYSATLNSNADRQASLGILFDMTDTTNGLLITEILEGGPADKSWLNIQAGDVITGINGNDITGENLQGPALANISGTKTLITYKTPDGSIKEEVIIPISKGAENELLYNRWIKQRAADVDKWSNGRLGYVHIRSMGDDSFRDVYADVLGKYNEKDGIVIDIRWNGGGRLHEDVEVLFSGKKYFTQVVRGEEACDMPSRRWNKPSIMVQCEACYSNAHGTPWVYKHTGIGKLVGAPVAGTMTSVNWVRMQDPTMVFGIPVTGYRLPDGSYLENTQLEPDIFVLNTPERITAGEDDQLRTAVNALLQQIDSNK